MPIYRAALCEDEAIERDQVAGLCRDIFAAQGVEAEILPFPTADGLRRAVEGGRAAFDLYLLDIQMRQGTSGLDLARQLYQWGVRDKIIFLTGSLEYAIHSYDVEPLHYLLKPVSRERLEEALQRALRKRGPQTVMFQRSGKVISLPVQEIRYLESRDHGIVVHLGEGVQTFSIPLAEPEPLPFTGVPEDYWACDAIRYVWENGLMAGTGADVFSPEGATTRGQIVTILWRRSVFLPGAGKPRVPPVGRCPTLPCRWQRIR